MLPAGVRIEDKGDALAVHTRGAADPDAALAGLRGPLQALAERTELMLEPGRRVIELRPPGTDKGMALTELPPSGGHGRSCSAAMTWVTCPPSPRSGLCVPTESPA